MTVLIHLNYHQRKLFCNDADMQEVIS